MINLTTLLSWVHKVLHVLHGNTLVVALTRFTTFHFQAGRESVGFSESRIQGDSYPLAGVLKLIQSFSNHTKMEYEL